MFYTAQSYRDCKQYEKAKEWYSKRIKYGDKSEEIWYSMFMICKIQAIQKLPHELVFKSYWECYNYDPIRIEPLADLTKYLLGNNILVYLDQFIEILWNAKYPTNRGLYITNDLYIYEAKLLACIILLALKRYDECNARFTSLKAHCQDNIEALNKLKGFEEKLLKFN